MLYNIFLFGTLRSEKIFKAVLNQPMHSFTISSCIAKRAKLKKMKDENYPVLIRTEYDLDHVKGAVIHNLDKNFLKRILFFESIEYKLDDIDVETKGDLTSVKYFALDQKQVTSEDWIYAEWHKNWENWDYECALVWMKYFNQFKNCPEEAEKLWPEMLNEIRVNFNKKHQQI